MSLQRSLILLKPDTLDRGVVGEIITRFEKRGIKIVGLKMLVSEKDTAEKHYTEDLARRRGEKIRKVMIAMITSGPIIAAVLEGVDIIEVVRQMIGATEPKSAPSGTIRGDYAHISYKHADERGIGIFNLIHASDSPESAQAEINIWFKPEELINHDPGYTKYALGRNFDKK